MFVTKAKIEKQYAAQIAELHETIASLQNEIAGYKATIAAYPDKHQSYVDATNNLKAQHSVEIAALKQQCAATENSVNKRVVLALSGLGVDTFANENVAPTTVKSDSDHFHTFVSLDGEAKTEYFKKHSEAINRAAAMVK